MNKLRTLLTWGLLSAAAHVMGYSLTVKPIEIEAGQSTNLIINLNNSETNLTAYQMKLFLPTGVTVQKKSNGKYAYTANADRHDGAFTVTVKDAADGSVLIAVFSPDKDVIAGTSGELIRLPIDVASTVSTSLQGSLKEIEFTDVNTQAYPISDVNFTMNLKGGSTPPDVSGNVTVSVPDVAITAGSTTDLIVNMQTDLTNLTAYQMKLFLPTGVTVQKKSNGKYAYTSNADRHDGAFTVTVKDAADGSVLIAVFSPEKDVITGTSGELIRLPIDVASTVTTSLQGSIKEIEFTDINTQSYNISDVNFAMTMGGQYRYYNLVITGIKGGSTGTIQFSEFDLLDDSFNEVEALSIYAGTNGYEAEDWANVADNDVHTKFCSAFNGNSYFLFDAGSEIEPCGYRFYTANDDDMFPERSPKSWRLYGSNTKLTDPADAGWVLIDEHNNDTIIQNVCNTPFDFYFAGVSNLLSLNKASVTLLPSDKLQLQASNRLRQNLTLQWTSNNEGVASVNNQGLVTANGPGTANITVIAAEDNTLSASCTVTVVSTLPGYRYYQFAIEATAGNTHIQLSEFDLLDQNGIEITPLTTYAHTGDSFNGEEQEKLFDDNTNTKYCGNFSAGTTLYIFIDAGKRVSLSGYRMTTGSDTGKYPDRNPTSWSLLGSNTQSSQPDDAVWTLLDHHENDNTLSAYDRASYNFFLTYQPNYVVNDETKSLSITTEESKCIVEFTHDFNGDWEALYLPFAIDYDAIKADFDLAEIDGVVQNDDNNDGTPDITVLSIMGLKGQTTTPNKPYLIRAKKVGKQTIVFDDVTIYPTEEASIDCSSTRTKYEFTGSYKSLSSTALKNRYIVQDGELVKGASKLSPCRWYMTATARNGAPLNLPSRIRIMPVEDVITGVSPLGETEEGAVIYNLSGQRLQKSQRGINIVGGKKILVK